MDVPMNVAALLGSSMDGITGRFPDDDIPDVVSFVGDFDLNGLVDEADHEHLRGCRSGPSVPQPVPACQDADLDGDGDVDHDDFGIFQRSRGAE